MQDFLNLEIKIAAKGDVFDLTMKHRKHDLCVTYSIKKADIMKIGEAFTQMMKRYGVLYRECTMKSLTAAQKKFYDELVKFYTSEGRAPSYNEMTELFGRKKINKGTAYYHIRKLKDAGWIWVDEDGHAIPKDIAAE